MPGLGVSLMSAANALSAIQEAIDAVQNNVVNANTPGYAAERVSFTSREFNPSHGLMGGVDVSLSSSRDQYLEQTVRRETSALGLQEQLNPLLANLQSAFSASGDSGLAAALSGFSSSFTTLSATPNDAAARANALQAAANLALAFNQAASRISQVGTDAGQVISSTTDQINSLASHIASLNAEIQNGARNDAGVAADLNSSIDSLSELVNISVANNADGTVSVLLGGQTPLALASQAFALSATQSPDGSGKILVMDQYKHDVSSQAIQGKLGAALQVQNQTVPYYLGTATDPGVLNNLAQTFAGQVNKIVTDAQKAAGSKAVPLFKLTNGTTAAATLSLGAITADQIVASDGTSSNGVATSLADLATESGLIDNQSFTEYYGTIAGKAGTDAAQAAGDLATQQALTSQAQSQRTQVSGVSLDAQASQLLLLQQAYQATARIVTILNSLSQTAVNLIPES